MSYWTNRHTRSRVHVPRIKLHSSIDSSFSRVALVASRWEDPVQAVLAGSQVTSGTHPGIYLRPSDIGCQYSRSTYTARFIVWQPRRAADTSTNWRQSLFCCCTASMEQATDWAETAAIDGLVSSWSENSFVSFCLRAPRYGLTLWCALGLLVGGAIQMPQLQLQLQISFFWQRNVVKRGICYEYVCPSVCLSHSWVTLERFKISKCALRCT